MFSKSDVFWLSRMLHAYLSAFAFLALIFFSLTGLFLNHPQWFHNLKPSSQEQTLTLPLQDISFALKSKSPHETLAAMVGQRTPLRGEYKSAEVIDNEIHIRLEGVKGSSTIIVHLNNGETETATENADPVSIIKDLHRGKNSGEPWKALIDITAYLVLALSLVGYILFFSLKFRLGTSLSLTAVSLLMMIGLFLYFVP